MGKRIVRVRIKGDTPRTQSLPKIVIHGNQLSVNKSLIIRGKKDKARKTKRKEPTSTKSGFSLRKKKSKKKQKKKPKVVYLRFLDFLQNNVVFIDSDSSEYQVNLKKGILKKGDQTFSGDYQRTPCYFCEECEKEMSAKKLTSHILDHLKVPANFRKAVVSELKRFT